MKSRLVLVVTLLVGLMSVGCHADPNDPVGQASELTDAVRRQNAIANIRRMWDSSLASSDGDRTGAEPRRIIDASVAGLTECYVSHPEDTVSQLAIIRLLVDMQDERAMPAYLAALDWRTEVSEDHAVAVAQLFRRRGVSEGSQTQVVEALGEALRRVRTNRGADNRMRIEFIRALGHIGDPSATDVLVQVATRLDENQNFLINRMATEQLARFASADAVDPMVRGLFLFAPDNPMMRMNDLASLVLVEVGRPAYEPLLALMRDENAQATRLINQYIRAAQRQAHGTPGEAGAQALNRETIRLNEATFALGQLGFRDAIEPLMTQITPLTDLPLNRAGTRLRNEDDVDAELFPRALSAVIALVRLNRTPADEEQIRDTVLAVFNRLPAENRPQMIVVMQHAYMAGFMPFLRDSAMDSQVDANVRILGYKAYINFANAQEIASIRESVESQTGFMQENLGDLSAVMDVAAECDQNLECWVGKLDDSNEAIVQKATYMLARYGRGNPAATTALVAHLGHESQAVRGDVLHALDFVATEGSQPAMDAITALEEEEEGQSSWQQIKNLALEIRARLRSRSAD